MVIQKAILKKGNLTDMSLSVETSFQPPNGFRVVSKSTGRRLNEKIEYEGMSPILAAQTMAEVIKKKVDEGYEITQEDTCNYAKLPAQSKKIEELCGYMAAESVRALQADGYDTGQYAEARIHLLHRNDKDPKKLKGMVIYLNFGTIGKDGEKK